MKQWIALPLALVVGLAHPGDDQARCRDTSSKSPRDELFEQFNVARASRDYASADALANRLVSGAWGGHEEELASYWIFERSQCRLDNIPAQGREQFLKYNDLLSGGLLVCEAANLPPQEKAQVRARMATVLDRFADGMVHAAGLYDGFARAATINQQALDLLARYHLDNPAFAREGDSALIEQIRAGRVDNVRVLLDHGYDADTGVSRDWRPDYDYRPDAKPPVRPLPVLPLQAAVDSLATRGAQALEIAQVLLANGANPNKLNWYPHDRAPPPADPALQARMHRLLADGGADQPAISAEYRGMLFEFSEDSQEAYLRFEIGNGSGKRVSIPAWKSEGLYLMNGLNAWSHLESRLLGGTKWNSPVSIEDGWSPSTTLEIEPGQSHEVLMSVAIFEMSQGSDGMRYRLWLSSHSGEIHSNAFDLHGGVFPIQQHMLKSKRDWYGEQRNTKSGR
jgi:hypothetical protein